MKRAFSKIEGSPEDDRATPSEHLPRSTPKISRKVSACTECQSRKIKCDLAPGKDICTRCERKSLRCVVNKSLQSILVEESEWKTRMESDAQKLQAAVSEILRSLGLPTLDAFDNASSKRSVSSAISAQTQPLQHDQPPENNSSQGFNNMASPGTIGDRSLPGVKFLSDLPSPITARSDPQNLAAGMAMTRENSQEPGPNAEEDDALVSAPMGTLFEVTKLRNLRSNPTRQHSIGRVVTVIEDDFISAGKISLDDADRLFSHFNTSLNHYLWGGIALVHPDLVSVRKSSTLLAAAIMTVTALHIPGMENVFDICYAEFVSLVCVTMLDRYHNLDAVRALAIGAFWLSDLSWKLSGHAIRIATELNLHQSYNRVMKGDQPHFESARLWYFLYVCDHHFSIAYGRPPLLREDVSIVQHQKFLQLPYVDQRDLRIHSQVSMFSILTEMYDHFGADDTQLDENSVGHIRHFNLRLDTWRAHWERQLAPNPHIGTYPSQGVVLHYHYAKLQLNSLSLRGYKPIALYQLPSNRKELAIIASSSAEAILHTVLDQRDMRNSIVGVPLYLHTMITFAATWLLKMNQSWRFASLSSDSLTVQQLVTDIISLLAAAKAGKRHLTFHIAEGLRKMLDRFVAWETRSLPSRLPVQSQPNMGSLQQVQTPIGLGYDMNFGMYSTSPGNSMQLWDHDYFPVGFFDVLSSAMP